MDNLDNNTLIDTLGNFVLSNPAIANAPRPGTYTFSNTIAPPSSAGVASVPNAVSQVAVQTPQAGQPTTVLGTQTPVVFTPNIGSQIQDISSQSMVKPADSINPMVKTDTVTKQPGAVGAEIAQSVIDKLTADMNSGKTLSYSELNTLADAELTKRKETNPGGSYLDQHLTDRNNVMLTTQIANSGLDSELKKLESATSDYLSTVDRMSALINTSSVLDKIESGGQEIVPNTALTSIAINTISKDLALKNKMIEVSNLRVSIVDKINSNNISSAKELRNLANEYYEKKNKVVSDIYTMQKDLQEQKMKMLEYTNKATQQSIENSQRARTIEQTRANAALNQAESVANSLALINDDTQRNKRIAEEASSLGVSASVLMGLTDNVRIRNGLTTSSASTPKTPTTTLPTTPTTTSTTTPKTKVTGAGYNQDLSI